MECAQRIREVISDKSLSINELSEMIGVSKRTIENYLGQKRLPGSEFLIAMTEHLGVSATWLLTGQGEQYVVPEQNRESTHTDLSQIDLKLIAHDIGMIKAALSKLEPELVPNDVNSATVGPINSDRLEQAIKLIDDVLDENELDLVASDRAKAYRITYELMDNDEKPSIDNIVSLFGRAS